MGMVPRECGPDRRCKGRTSGAASFSAATTRSGFAASRMARSGPMPRATSTAVCLPSPATSKRWPRMVSTRSAPTRYLPGGSSMRRTVTASRCWSACPGSSTSPSSTIGAVRGRSPHAFACPPPCAPVIRPSSAMPSATRSRLRWFAGTVRARSSGSSSDSPTKCARSIPARSSRTSTTRRPNTSSSRSWISCASTSTSRPPTA